MEKKKMKLYTDVLKKELVPAMGCTEPIAIAYAAALLKELLTETPTSIKAMVSPNVMKNAKSVVVPNTGGLKGIDAAVAAGIVAGDPELKLEVLSHVISKQHPQIAKFLQQQSIKISLLPHSHLFDVCLEGVSESHQAKVRLSDTHTNVTYLEKDGEVLKDTLCEEALDEATEQYPFMTTAEIVEYCDSVPIEDIREVIERQIDYNTAISKEGLKGNYGANIGKVLLKEEPVTIQQRARAVAAAGSDARMGGCELPVIIVCGSGNQGMTASLPIIEYAKEEGIDHERMLRAIALSDLLAIHVKDGIGTLSAYCGAVCAGCSAGAGIAYLLGGDRNMIAHTMVNALAIVSGIICDGAKPSCAAKIASSVDAGLLGYEMAKQGQQFYSGEGIVTKGIEGNIRNVSRLGRIGMRGTDEQIMEIMFDDFEQ